VTSIDVEGLKSFVLKRRSKDGGFAFCNPLPSSLPETFYAVYILNAVGADIEDKDKLVNFLLNKLNPDIYSIFYVYNTLSILNEDLPDYSEFLLKRLKEAMSRKHRSDLGHELGITATYSFENPNILREIHMIVTSLKLLGAEIPEEICGFIRQFKRNKGYGIGRANLKDTFYAVSIFKDEGVVDFVLEHECERGGFAKHPHAHPPYLEDTFYAISILNAVGYSYRNEKTIRYIFSLQNPDGGFRRSIYGGISTLEDSYYAVASLKLMEVKLR